MRPLIERRPFAFEVASGAIVAGELDDYPVMQTFRGEHENDPAFWISQALIGPGDVVLDVGANVGLWALPAARRAGADGKVIAFEPIPGTHARLERNLALNGLDNMRCEQKVVCDRPGSATMFVGADWNTGISGLLRREGAEAAVEIDAVTLDGYCAERGVERVDFLKVDVEGAELRVFRAASSLLGSEQAPAIVFEINEQLARGLGSSCAQVKRLLANYGYGLYEHSGAKLEPVSVTTTHVHTDLFALKARHLAPTERAISRS